MKEFNGCPRLSIITPKAAKCSLLPKQIFPGPELTELFPCLKCCQEWNDGPPQTDLDTSVLREMKWSVPVVLVKAEIIPEVGSGLEPEDDLEIST